MNRIQFGISMIVFLAAAGCSHHPDGRYVIPQKAGQLAKADAKVEGVVVSVRGLEASEVPVLEQSSPTGRNTLLVIEVQKVLSGDIEDKTLEVRYGAFSQGGDGQLIANPKITKGARVEVSLWRAFAQVNVPSSSKARPVVIHGTKPIPKGRIAPTKPKR
jgi:hypothetical protein